MGLVGGTTTLGQRLNDSVPLQSHLGVVGLHGIRDHVLWLLELVLLLLLDLSDHLVHGVVGSELVLLGIVHQILHEEDGFRYLSPGQFRWSKNWNCVSTVSTSRYCMTAGVTAYELTGAAGKSSS